MDTLALALALAVMGKAAARRRAFSVNCSTDPMGGILWASGFSVLYGHSIDHVLQSKSSCICLFLPSFLFHLSYESEPEKAIDGAQEAGFRRNGGTSRQMINIRF